MLILDKQNRKDYYDFLSGVYGVDEKVVLDRREYEPEYMYKLTKVYICDRCIEGWYQDGRLYLGDSLVEVGTLEKGKNWQKLYSFRRSYLPKDTKRYYITDGTRLEYVLPDMYEPEVNVNTELNCPILLENHFGKLKSEKTRKNYSKFPKLSNLGIQKVLPAHNIYLMLTGWLSKKDIDMPSDPTDMQRWEGRGFSKQDSFRNTK